MAMSSGLVANPGAAAFARPADTTAYASGDLVANNTTAGSVVPVKIKVGSGPLVGVVLTRVRLIKNGTSVTNATFRVHVYRGAAPTPANGDNGAFSTDGAANYCGAFDIPSMQAFTDGAAGMGAPVTGNSMLVKPTSGNDVWCLLEARGAYTPASGETFQLFFEELQD